jgi:pimeloyl-ACP methyl ester carboxylesterase
MIELKNGRVSLALYELSSGEGPPLLALHELGGSAEDFRMPELPWPGPAYALDFSGHGRSGRLHGGEYYPELWAADADCALAWLATQHKELIVLGRGLGAYVALLLAGARPELVRAAVLCDGEGSFGDERDPLSIEPVVPDIEAIESARGLRAEPKADPTLHQHGDHVRPADYAARFAQAARKLVLLEGEAARPKWWQATAQARSSVRAQDLGHALRIAKTD